MLKQQRRRRRRQRHFTITFIRFEAVEDVCGNRDTYTRLLFSLRFDTLASAHLITLFCQKSYFWVNFLFLLFAQMAAQWPCHYRPETILEPPLLFFCTGIFSHFRSLTLSLSRSHISRIGLGMQKAFCSHACSSIEPGILAGRKRDLWVPFDKDNFCKKLEKFL